jgi:hypothetical protein
VRRKCSGSPLVEPGQLVPYPFCSHAGKRDASFQVSCRRGSFGCAFFCFVFCTRARPKFCARPDGAVAQSDGCHALVAKSHGSDTNSAVNRHKRNACARHAKPDAARRWNSQSDGGDAPGGWRGNRLAVGSGQSAQTRPASKTPTTCARPAIRRRPSPSSGLPMSAGSICGIG